MADSCSPESSGPFFGGMQSKDKEEHLLIRSIAVQIMRDLNIKSEDGDIFLRLIMNNLQNLLLGRNGDLDRYYNDKLDKLLPEFYLHFDLDAEQMQIDKNHGDHAKLWSIMKAIQKKYDIKDPKRKGDTPRFGNQSGNDCEVMQSGSN